MEECINFARKKFQIFYYNDILQLLSKFPKDHMDKGKPFWKLPRRMPNAIKFDPHDDLHFAFIWHTALIYAYLYKIPVDKSVWTKEKVIETSLNITVPEFVPKNKDYITDTKIKKVEEKAADPELYSNTIKELSQISVPKHLAVVVRPFEKDDDTNSHVDFITASSNLRATNYGIECASRMESKRIAGRIVPAIATTTVTVAGLVSLELTKIVMNNIKEMPIEVFRNTTLNLALPMYAMAEPGPPRKIPITGGAYYTVWHSWSVHEPEWTLQQFCDHFNQKLNLKVGGVFQGNKRIYTSFLPADRKKLTKKMKELLGTVKEDFVELTVCFDNESGEKVDAPEVRFFMK